MATLPPTAQEALRNRWESTSEPLREYPAINLQRLFSSSLMPPVMLAAECLSTEEPPHENDFRRRGE
ncbi:hypothetical protein [Nonomuraea sp. NPDC003804]|uniref:hypothetical protein n=1 Tax=Nonomuraea sp. NPDC003804 TaxID=3154547 RepID=UPI0033A0BD65